VGGEWGLLAEPLHHGAAADGDPPWRENAFLSFWAPGERAAAVIHVSTSPNAEGRRARASVTARGRVAELLEPLEPMTMSSESIDVDLSGTVRVASPSLSVELELTPRFCVADYGELDIFTPLGDNPPIRHVQQAADVRGWVEVEGERTAVAGRGVRDRTWGFRDDQRAGASRPDDGDVTVEYLAGSACLDDLALTFMKQRKRDGRSVTGGFVMTDVARPVVACEVTRDAAGLLGVLEVTLADGEQLVLEVVPGPRLGFWLPTGSGRKGPTLSAYDEFVSLAAGAHGTGGGLMEHGVVRFLT
jgi:hypothetical protein